MKVSNICTTYSKETDISFILRPYNCHISSGISFYSNRHVYAPNSICIDFDAVNALKCANCILKMNSTIYENKTEV